MEKKAIKTSETKYDEGLIVNLVWGFGIGFLLGMLAAKILL